MDEISVDVAVIGSGSAGLYALSQVRPSGKSFVLINGGETGTTCARVGCMPSKALIQVAEDYHRRKILGRYGVEGHEELEIDIEEALEYVRDLRDTFVDRVQSNSTDQMPPEKFIRSYAKFIDPNTLEVDGKRIHAKSIVIATGSRPVIPEAWKAFGDRIISTDELFELEQLPDSMAVIGLGVIGLEIGQSLSRLGVEVSGFDMIKTIGGLTDPEVAKTALETICRDFPMYLGEAASISEEKDGRLKVTAGDKTVIVDKVFASLGRRPNLDNLAIENAGIDLNEQGIPKFNSNTMRIGNSHIYIAGDVTTERPILHEAGDEGKIAGYNASHDEQVAFKRKESLAITFCDPNICMVGTPWSQLDQDQTAIGEVRLGPVGRAIIMGKNRGMIRIYADKKSGKLVGAEMISVRAENLGHLLVWSLQQGLTIGEMLQMPFYHPVIEEAMQAALNDCYAKVEQKNSSPIPELRVL